MSPVCLLVSPAVQFIEVRALGPTSINEAQGRVVNASPLMTGTSSMLTDNQFDWSSSYVETQSTVGVGEGALGLLCLRPWCAVSVCRAVCVLQQFTEADALPCA